MTSVPFIAFYPSDWRGGVAMLTDFEELVYLKICLAIWGDGHPVHEDDVPRLFRREPDADEVRAACATLLRLRKLQRDDDGNLTNERALEAYRDAQKRVRAGKKGAASRWKGKRKRENAAALRQQVPPQCQPEPESDSDSLCRENLSCAVSAWNEMAERCGLASVKRVTNGRRTKLAARLKDAGGIEGWQTALGKIETNPFLRGENDRQWRIDFDFMLRESSFTKLMEGAYDRSGIDAPTGRRSQRDITADGLTAFREALDE